MNIAVFNVDGSKRDKKLQDKKKKVSTELLSNYLYEKVDNNLPLTSAYALIVTEFNKCAAKKLEKLLPETTDWYGERFNSNADYTATYWNEIGWHGVYKDRKLECIYSSVGKYCAVVLEHEHTEQRVMYVSVHLPRPQTSRIKHKQALENLKELSIEARTEKYNVDHIVIAGDFNTDPDTIESILGEDFCAGLKGEEIKTTRAGNLIDNVVTTKGAKVEIKPQILGNDNDLLSHYPLFGTLTFEK